MRKIHKIWKVTEEEVKKRGWKSMKDFIEDTGLKEELIDKLYWDCSDDKDSGDFFITQEEMDKARSVKLQIISIIDGRAYVEEHNIMEYNGKLFIFEKDFEKIFC